MSNREACRDGFVRLLEEGSVLLNALPGGAGSSTGLSVKGPGKSPHDAGIDIVPVLGATLYEGCMLGQKPLKITNKRAFNFSFLQ